MDDFQLAFGASGKIGDLYKEGKTFSSVAPAYALTQLRGLASLYCDVLDRDFNENDELSFKIKSLDNRNLLKPQVRRHLRTLQMNGNKGAHPEKYDFQVHDFRSRAAESIEASLGLIESVYLYRQETIPFYKVCEMTDDGLKDVCYRAMIEDDIEAIHLVGVYFKEKADHLKLSDKYFAPDGYGSASRAGIEKAMSWFKQGSKLHHPDCMYQYGIYQANSSDQSQQEEGEQLICLAAEVGHANASVFLADCYMNGSRNFLKDEGRAHTYFEIAAQQGHPEALSMLGGMYALGIGCERDDAKAASYTIRASELGFPQAQFNLFVLYRNGQGVDVNLGEALRWLVEAAEQEFPAAINSLGYEIRDGSFPDRPLSDALEYFERSFGNPQYRASAAQAYAEVLMRLDDTPANLEKAACALQFCYETIIRSNEHHDLLPFCLELSRIVISKFRSWLNSVWLEGGKIDQLLLCTLFSRDGVPVANKMERFSSLQPIIGRMKSGSEAQKQEALFELLREGEVDMGEVGKIFPLKEKQNFASQGIGRNDPCPCRSGLKFKKCHGA